MSQNLNTDIVDESSIFGSPGGVMGSRGPGNLSNSTPGSGYAPRSLPPSSRWDFRNPYASDSPNNPTPRSSYAPQDTGSYRPAPVNPGNRGHFFPENSYAGRDMGWKPSIFEGMNTPPVNRYQPTSPTRNSPGSSLGSNPGSSFRGNAPGVGNNNSPGSPGRYGSNPPDFSQNPPVSPPGQYRPGGGAPLGENPSGPPTFGTSNFDQYFNDFFDNFYGGTNEPPVAPIPPPFQGGQLENADYLIKLFISYSNGGSEYYTTGPHQGKIGGIKIDNHLTTNGVFIYVGLDSNPTWVFARAGAPLYVVFASIVSVIKAPWSMPNTPDLSLPPISPGSPGTSSPPNQNFSPLALLGLDPLLNPGTDPLSGLDPLLNPGTQSPPAIDPTQHPDTYKPPLPDFSIFPGFKPLPDGLAPSSPSPYGSAGNQNAGSSTTRDPFGNRSYGYPSTSAPSTTQINPTPNVPNVVKDPLTGTQTPVTQTRPNPDPLAPNPSTVNPNDCENPTDPCEKNRKDQLNRIEKNTQNNNPSTNIQGTIQTERCSEIRKTPSKPNDPDTQSFSYSGVNFLGISNQIIALSNQVESIRKDFCYITSNLAIPDSWNVKTQPNRPQLVIIYAEITYQQNQKKLGKSRWSFTIPYFDEAKKNTINLPDYKKGDWMAIAELKDGSKIVINAVNEVTAKRICTLALTYVISSMRIDPKEIKLTPRKGNISPKLITPVLAHYYPQGRGLTPEGELKPNWTIQLKNKDND